MKRRTYEYMSAKELELLLLSINASNLLASDSDCYNGVVEFDLGSNRYQLVPLFLKKVVIK